MKKPSAFTLIEIILCVVIVGILASLAIAGYSKQIKTAEEKKIKLNLSLVWSDEQDFLVYHGRYAKDWSLLSIEKPADERYVYKITKATQDDIEITATLKDADTGFLINTAGEIKKF